MIKICNKNVYEALKAQRLDIKSPYKYPTQTKGLSLSTIESLVKKYPEEQFKKVDEYIDGI